MKLKYDAPKGRRIKRKWFYHIEVENGKYRWWDNVDKKWTDFTNTDHAHTIFGPVCRSVRAFRRHVRKHKNYMGSSCTFRLVSKYVGHDVYI